MKKIFLTMLLLIIGLHSETYRINGVKEFHRTVKNFISKSESINIKNLDSEDIMLLTYQVSSITLLVDELTDNNYLQSVLTAIESYDEKLNKLPDEDEYKEIDITYLNDLKSDMINQNKSDISGGTKVYRFDIDDISDDDLPLYEAKKEIIKNGMRTWNKYFPGMSKIDIDIITRANELNVEELAWNYIDDPSEEEIESLLRFKGDKILFPVLRNIQPVSLAALAKFTGKIEFDKLIVDDELIDILSKFKASELKVTGLKNEYNATLSAKLGSRYKKSVSFKKRKKN